ncbi:Putative B3 domain-containing protein At2g27410 [Linum perenne]
MTILPCPVVRRRRSPRRLGRRGLSAFESLLAAAAVASECGCGGHSHPFTCFSTSVKQRKPAFLETHHSLFLIPPKKTIAKRRIVFLPPKRPPIAAGVSFPLPHQSSSPQILSSFSKDEMSVANILLGFSLQPQPSSPATAVNVSPAISAVAPLPPLRLRVILPSITASPTLPVNFTEVPKVLFPPILKSRVSAIVPCVLENTFALVIRKKLTETDLSKRHVRLSIPEKQVASDFLTGGEKMLLEKKSFEKKCPPMDLGVFLDPKLEPIYGGQLVKWVMNNSPVYNLTKAWKPILDKKKENRLKLDAGDEIELWSFRVASGELCFVMVSEETTSIIAAGAAAANESKKKGSSCDSGSGRSTISQEADPVQMFEDHSSSGIDLNLKL